MVHSDRPSLCPLTVKGQFRGSSLSLYAEPISESKKSGKSLPFSLGDATVNENHGECPSISGRPCPSEYTGYTVPSEEKLSGEWLCMERTRCVCVCVWWCGRENVAKLVCQFQLSGGSRHSYSTVSSLSVVRKKVSFKLIVPVRARAHHVNIISCIYERQA